MRKTLRVAGELVRVLVCDFLIWTLKHTLPRGVYIVIDTTEIPRKGRG